MIKVVPLMDESEQLQVSWDRGAGEERANIRVTPDGRVELEHMSTKDVTDCKELERALELARDIASGRIEIARDF